MAFFKVEGLTKYFGGLAAADNISFEVQKGEIFGLIGPNGSGKTTLFNLISGFHRPSSGVIYFKDRRMKRLKPYQINRLGIARTFQVVKPLKRMTVLDNVISAAFCHTHSLQVAKEIAFNTIAFCGLKHRIEMLAKHLTIGDRKRLEIARALGTQPELILLDETFAGLNPSELNGAIQLVQKMKASGVTIIIVEHIMKVIMNLSDRIHAINFGRTITEGSPQEVASHQEVIEAYLGEPLE